MENLTVDYAKKIAMPVFKGFMKFDQFKSLVDEVVNLSRDNMIDKIMVDTSDMGAMKPENVEYIETVFYPSIMGRVKALAFIFPEKAIAKLATSRANKSNNAIPLMNFSVNQKMQAFNWLMEF